MKTPNGFYTPTALTEREAKLEKFCEENGIPFQKNKDTKGRGRHSYQFEFTPNYLDETEAQVIQYLESKEIPYYFRISENGMHHYSFSEMIDMQPYGPDNLDSDTIKAFISDEMPKLKRDYEAEKQILKTFQEEIGYLKKEIETLKLQIEVEQNQKLKTWWDKVKYACWKPYKEQVDQITENNIKNLKMKIEDQEAKIEDQEAKIAHQEAESQTHLEMLILAGAIFSEDV